MNNFKVGDIVKLIEPDIMTGIGPTGRGSLTIAEVGEWGRIYEIDGLMVRVQLGGYSKPKSAFFQACHVGYWQLELYNLNDDEMRKEK